MAVSGAAQAGAGAGAGDEQQFNDAPQPQPWQEAAEAQETRNAKNMLTA